MDLVEFTPSCDQYAYTFGGTVTFSARFSVLTLPLPVAPMLGTVGVAPAAGEVRSSLVPDRFGGNMDSSEIRAGATVYLGVNVEGALFDHHVHR